MMNQFKKLILLILVNQLKNSLLTKNKEFEEKIYDHNKYITTSEFNIRMKRHFDERLKQVNLASKNNVADFIKKTITKITLKLDIYLIVYLVQSN